MGATGYFLVPASVGQISQAAAFTLYALGGTFSGTENFTPSDNGGGGAWSSSPLVPGAGSYSASVNYTAAALGSHKINFTNNQGWTDQQGYRWFTLDGTTNTGSSVGAGNTLTMSFTVSSTYVGTYVVLTGGTNVIPGAYKITAASGSVLTFDRACTSGAASGAAGMVYYVGATAGHTYYTQTYGFPNRIGGYNFSSTPATPYSGNRSNIFYPGEAVRFRLEAASGVTGYEVYNIDGSLVDSGPLSAPGSGFGWFTISAVTDPGWYFLVLYSGTSNTTVGQTYRAGSFVILNHSSNLYERPKVWMSDAAGSGGYPDPAQVISTQVVDLNADTQPASYPWACIYSGQFLAPSTGSYTFTLNMNYVSCRLSIDGTPVIELMDSKDSSGAVTSNAISLTGGQRYDFELIMSSLGHSGFNATYDNWSLTYSLNGGSNQSIPTANQFSSSSASTPGGMTLTYYDYIYPFQAGDDCVTHALCGMGPHRLSVVNISNAANGYWPYLDGMIRFWANNQKGKDSQRPLNLFISFPYYRIKTSLVGGYTLKTAVNSGDTTATLTSAYGLGAGVMLDFVNGGTTETKTIQSANTTTGVVTFTAAFTNAFATSGTTISQHTAGATAIGVQNPNQVQLFTAGAPIDINNGTETVNIASNWNGSNPITLASAITGSYAGGTAVNFSAAAEDAAVTATVNRYKNNVLYYEGTNEPDQSGIGVSTHIANVASFRAAVRAATTSAKVLGPENVNANSNTGMMSATGYTTQFFSGGGVVDVLSFHGYNSVNGNLALGRLSLTGIKSFMSAHGLSSAWHTESGSFFEMYGSCVPTFQAKWGSLFFLLYEMNGIPTYQNLFWTTGNHQDNNFPMYLCAGDTSYTLTPLAVVYRVFHENVWGTNCSSAFTFGDADDYMVGGLWSGPSKNVAIFLCPGDPDASVTLNVSGGNGTLNVQDGFGKSYTVPASNGQATLSGFRFYMPVYVILQSGQSVTPVVQSFGTNIANAHGTVVVSGNQTNVSSINNNSIEAAYWNLSTLLGGYTDWSTPPSFPATIEVDFGVHFTFNRLHIFCEEPWQSALAAPLEYDLQYWNGSAWVNVVPTVSRIPKDLAVRYGHLTAVTFWDRKSVFRHTFTEVTTSKIRMVIYRASWGGHSSQMIAEAGGQGQAYPEVSMVEFKAYNEHKSNQKVVVKAGAGLFCVSQ